MSNIYGATSLIGGGSGALDGIDGLNLGDGDACQVITDIGVYWYHLNATSSASENSPFRINPDTNAGTKSWHLVGTTARIGSLVELNTNETITTGIATYIPWDQEIYDDANFWEGVTNPSRLTIPIGVTGVKVYSNNRWESPGTLINRTVEIIRNRSNLDVRIANTSYENTLDMKNLASTVIPVSSGDYFEFRVTHERGSNLFIESSKFTWFSIEAVNFA